MEIVSNNQKSPKKILLGITVIEDHLGYKNLFECRETVQLMIRNKIKINK